MRCSPHLVLSVQQFARAVVVTAQVLVVFGGFPPEIKSIKVLTKWTLEEEGITLLS